MAVSMSRAGGGANQQGGGATALAARHDHLVGILGGMGPAATADFYDKLIRRTPAARDQDHLRVVIWADPTIPDRSAAVIDGSTDPYPAILDGANRLRDLGATLVAMPCNTAHVFLPNLVRDTGLRFIDMVLETVTALTRREESVTALGCSVPVGPFTAACIRDASRKHMSTRWFRPNGCRRTWTSRSGRSSKVTSRPVALILRPFSEGWLKQVCLSSFSRAPSSHWQRSMLQHITTSSSSIRLTCSQTQSCGRVCRSGWRCRASPGGLFTVDLVEVERNHGCDCFSEC